MVWCTRSGRRSVRLEPDSRRTVGLERMVDLDSEFSDSAPPNSPADNACGPTVEELVDNFRRLHAMSPRNSESRTNSVEQWVCYYAVGLKVFVGKLPPDFHESRVEEVSEFKSP